MLPKQDTPADRILIELEMTDEGVYLQLRDLAFNLGLDMDTARGAAKWLKSKGFVKSRMSPSGHIEYMLYARAEVEVFRKAASEQAKVKARAFREREEAKRR